MWHSNSCNSCWHGGKLTRRRRRSALCQDSWHPCCPAAAQPGCRQQVSRRQGPPQLRRSHPRSSVVPRRPQQPFQPEVNTLAALDMHMHLFDYQAPHSVGIHINQGHVYLPTRSTRYRSDVVAVLGVRQCLSRQEFHSQGTQGDCRSYAALQRALTLSHVDDEGEGGASIEEAALVKNSMESCNNT